MADIFHVRYDELETIAKQFIEISEWTINIQTSILKHVEVLRSGDWLGPAGVAFFNEIDIRITPALDRLHAALQLASLTVHDTMVLIRNAEEEAASLFDGFHATQAAINSPESKGILGFIGDLFGGAYAELSDMLKGLKHLVLHPIDTLKGLGYAITHPTELWNAFKQPYVEDWQNGHPGRSVGRGIMFIGSLLLGTKGVDKALKGLGLTAKGTEAAAITGEIASETGEVAAKVGRLIIQPGRTISASEEAFARMLVADGKTVEVVAESTVKGVRTADFLVDGVKTELKTVNNITSADVRGALTRRILDGAGQAEHIIIDSRGQAGFTQELAERAIKGAYGAEAKNGLNRIQNIRIVGDGFDITVPYNP